MASENAHAAKIENGVVTQVIVIPNQGDDDAAITAYCNGIGLEGLWLDTSYLGARRGKYAGIGDRFDAEADEFVSPVIEAPAPIIES